MSRYEQSPSYRLNEAFTEMVEVFKDDHLKKPAQIRPAGIERLVPIEGVLISRAPHVYDRAPASLTYRTSNNYRLIAPIGEYGEDWTKQFLGAAIQLVENGFSDHDHVAKLGEKYGSTMRNYTFHGNHADGDLTKPITQTFFEGQGQTSLYALGLLTHYKVPGYENDPQGLMDELIASGVFSNLSLTVPPNVMENMAVSGTVLRAPAIVKRDSTGRFALRDAIMRHWKDDKNMYDQSTGNAPLDKPGCPLGRNLPGATSSGVDMGVSLLADTIRSSYKRPQREVNRQEYFNDVY